MHWKILAVTCLCTFRSSISTVSDYDKCNFDLGMQSGVIPDEDLSASSTYHDSLGPRSSRLNQNIAEGAWCAAGILQASSYEYLQVNLSTIKVVTGVATQGRFADGRGLEYVEEFKVQYLRPGLGRWRTYRNLKGEEVFLGNIDTNTVVTRHLEPAIVAWAVRVVPHTNHPRVACMRVEIYGCAFTGGLLHYDMPQGNANVNGVNLTDKTYDGQISNGYLSGGLGQLTDGQLGQGDRLWSFSSSQWVAWKKERLQVAILFQFDVLRRFTTMEIFYNNIHSLRGRVFSSVEILFSRNGTDFENSVSFVPPEETVVDEVRNFAVDLRGALGSSLKVILHPASDLMVVSEIKFISDIEINSEKTSTVQVGHTHRQAIESSTVDIEVKSDTRSTVQVGHTEGIDTDDLEDALPAVIGGGVAALLLVVILVVAGVCCFRRHRHRTASSTKTNSFIFKPYAAWKTNRGSGHEETTSDESFSLQQNHSKEENRPPLPPKCSNDIPSPSSPKYYELEPEYERLLQPALRVVQPQVQPQEQPQEQPQVQPASKVVQPASRVVQSQVQPGREHLLDLTEPYAISDIVLPIIKIQGASGNNVYGVTDQKRLSEGTPPIEIPRGQLKIIRTIGSGVFGEVQLGEWSKTVVAVKMLREGSSDKSVEEFNREIRIMSSLNHPSVVRALAVCKSPGPLCVVLEYTETGDLHHFLKERLCVSNDFQDKKFKTVGFQQLLSMLMQLAAGMRHLESKGFVHRDLAARNCLVGPGFTLKITDLAMSRRMDFPGEYFVVDHRNCLPIRWQPYEALFLGAYTNKSDVWSFGVTAWELLTLCKAIPYHQITDRNVLTCLQKFMLPPLHKPLCCPDRLYQVIVTCFGRDPSDRPSFKELVRELR